MSTKLELNNNKKPLIRRVHRHGNYYSVGLPQAIKERLKIGPDEYFKVFYDAENDAVIYQKLESG